MMIIITFIISIITILSNVTSAYSGAFLWEKKKKEKTNKKNNEMKIN